MASNNAQAAQKAVETIKETAANIGAAANTGAPANSSLEKTKTTIQENCPCVYMHLGGIVPNKPDINNGKLKKWENSRPKNPKVSTYHCIRGCIYIK
ncbi:hypothetical protein JHK85_004664 [Glycine max]|nr:hypothetical protein JHK85_004664 [Glycine max]KAG5080421.1 hypothetical protein JHK86_004486 [Glycine max]